MFRRHITFKNQIALAILLPRSEPVPWLSPALPILPPSWQGSSFSSFRPQCQNHLFEKHFSWGCNHLTGQMDWKMPFLGGSLTWWQVDSGCWVTAFLSPWRPLLGELSCPVAWRLASPRTSNHETSASYHLASEVTCPHFHVGYLVPWLSTEETTEVVNSRIQGLVAAMLEAGSHTADDSSLI